MRLAKGGAEAKKEQHRLQDLVVCGIWGAPLLDRNAWTSVSTMWESFKMGQI